MTTLARRAVHPTDAERSQRQARLQQAIASATLEGIEFTAEDLAELHLLDQQVMTDEEAIAYLVNKYQQPE